ncbi:TcpD family membrane protein [Desulfotomaculum copahuensis]|uniref:Uncharacterized protein n=1 Tax=Desulfotomaculum copahuensis TaxID=1838280 RepID=A0A1B7LG92_9FIRM|nr:TcpD family membrane protein [Desulfotomaculum copahuensis]OAT83707.1 hypothetical protein A6M21_07675 [Desulfotomaculum copahuensis]
MRIPEKIRQGTARVLPVTVLAATWLALTPGVAAAYDFKAGTQSILTLVKTVIIIAVLVAGVMEFLKHQVTKTIAIVVVGAILIFLASPDAMQSVGNAIMSLFGGSSGP